MKNIRPTWSRRVRATCLVLGAVLLMGFIAPAMTAQAALSLPHIQNLLTGGGVFNILEILPDERAGSLGYYVAGQEPARGWKDELARLTGGTARRARAAEIFSGLTAAGILGGGTATPLTLTANYDEKMPWETVPAGYEPLTLAAEEQATVRGTITPAAGGAYAERYEYQLNKSGFEQNAQKILQLVYLPSAAAAGAYAGTYFYQPTFVRLLDDEDLTGRAGLALYELVDGAYVYAGTPDTLGGVLFGAEYYYVSGDLEPFDGYDATHPYAAVADGFRTVEPGETGYFGRTVTGYVLAGGGTHNFTPGTGSGTSNQTLFYRKVFITGGFRNNNWFLKHVLDMTDADIADPAVRRPDILVRTVRASNVTEALVRGASLVVLSSGFKPVAAAGSPYLSYTADDGANTLTQEAALALYNEVADGLPLIIDHRLMDSAQPGARLKKLIRLCLRDKAARTPITGIGFDAIGPVTDPAEFASDADKSFVKDGIFCLRAPFNPGSIGTARLEDLASLHFAASMTPGIYNAGFSAVYSEIQSENFLRRIDGVAQLPEVVTPANVIRYIINYAGRRVVSAKTALHVLEIQPAKTGSPLTAAKVSGWSAIPAADITITTLTSAEFAGRIEDINEVYDLVYIGSDITNINANNMTNSVGSRAYNAIGGTVRTNLSMAGLLDRDYFNESPNYNANGVPTAPIDSRNNYSGVTSDANLMRFSGNDIPQSRANDLVNFARAGYPVVLANDLTVTDASNTTGNGIGVSTSKVDSSSYFYDALREMVKKGNVLKEASAAELRPYLFVSKPAILMAAMPPVYAEDGPTLATGVLTYRFTIENQTDPTPRETTYDCGLFIDLNADGRYAANERITDIEILQGGNVVDLVGGVYRLSAGVEYTVNRQMPAAAAGIIPWKLSVVKNGAGNEHIHASKQEYTRIQPTAKKVINVLQIVQTDRDRLNLAGNDIYRQYIRELEDFDIRLDSIGTTPLAARGDENAIFNYLDGYDMLIIGFNDTYDGISQNSALAIRRFIDSKKSVLFSHDTTSFYALPSNNYPRWTGGTSGSFYNLGTGWSLGGSATNRSENNTSVSFRLAAAAAASVAQSWSLAPGDYTLLYDKTSNAHLAISSSSSYVSPTGELSSGATFEVGGSSNRTVTFTATSDDGQQATLSGMKLVRKVSPSGALGTGWAAGGSARNLSQEADSVEYTLSARTSGSVTRTVTGLYAGTYTLDYSSRTGGQTLTGNGISLPGFFSVTDGRAAFILGASNSSYLFSADYSLEGLRLARVPGSGGWGANSSASADDSVTVKKNVAASKKLVLPAGSYDFAFSTSYCDVSFSATPALQVESTASNRISFTLTAQAEVTINAKNRDTSNARTVTGMRFYKWYVEETPLPADWSGTNVTSLTQSAGNLSFKNNITPVSGTATRTLTNLTAGSSYTFRVTNSDSSVGITLNGEPVTGGSHIFVAPSNRTAVIVVTAANATPAVKNVSVSGMTYGLSGLQPTNVSNDISSGWGYYFNTVIRDAVGLDRYGVTSKELLSGGSELRTIVRAGGGSVKTNEQQILDARRGIAYEPNSAKASVVDEAQGYTNYTLKRFTNSSALNNSYANAGLSTTSKVAQVNQGQITTYPFDINLGSFSKTPGKAATMDVMTTHDQYFQLNMNADDVVVWYCLSGGNFDSNPNDVTNAYYIYNKGNVTYTGVGHFTSTVTSTSDAFHNEAKLFINTMIAAYQAGAQAPSVEIRDPSSTGYKLDAMYFVADNYAENGTMFGASRQIMFKISDPNLSTQKTMALKFFYTDATGATVEFTPLGGRVDFGTSGSLSAGSDAFRGNVLYRVALPDAVLGAGGLGNTNLSKSTVTVRVLTRVGGGAAMQAEATIDLIKIGLFDLR